MFSRHAKRVPPSPDVINMLYMSYLRDGKPNGVTFRQYLKIIGYVDPAPNTRGMDDGWDARHCLGNGPDLIHIPQKPITGSLRVKVLLVDFPDKPGSLPVQHYEDLLFSERSYPTGSMRDYYWEVSQGKVDVTGSVHGWLRLPRPYSWYTNGQSGLGAHAYPRNAQGMAEDAVNVAVKSGVAFEPELDVFGDGIVTALFIIHAGRGAEVTPPGKLAQSEIWSHKWNLHRLVDVGSGLSAGTYLTVPERCKVGVCAHELGHLAFQWQDFYDPDYNRNGSYWDGAGRWDLMASGSYNGGGHRPAHPAALHKVQHGWIDVEELKSSKSMMIPPFGTQGKGVVKIVSKRYKAGQYLLLENRSRVGFDRDLPGEGLLVWKVDESGEMEGADGAGLYLVQADGRRDLENPYDDNQGDDGDPFPGRKMKTTLGDTGELSTSFPGQAASGIKLNNIRLDGRNIHLDVDID